MLCCLHAAIEEMQPKTHCFSQALCFNSLSGHEHEKKTKSLAADRDDRNTGRQGEGLDPTNNLSQK